MSPKPPSILYELLHLPLSLIKLLILRHQFYSRWIMLGIYNYWWCITSLKYSIGKKEIRMFYVANVIIFSVFLELLWKPNLLIRYNLNRFQPPQVEPVLYSCTVVRLICQVHKTRYDNIIWLAETWLKSVHLCLS